MLIIKNRILALLALSLLTTNLVFANTSVQFFASNNTKQIDLQTAYLRLIGKEQQDLQNNMIGVLQKNHIEQGKFEDILGTYRMSNDQNITADNSERFNTSPNQQLSEEKAFSLAQELAIDLNQESVAVLIPDQSTMGDITVSFTSHKPSIHEITDLVHNKLPATYSQAFSLHLENKYSDFDKTTINEIEWLGSNINLEEIKHAFPNEKINYHFGKVYLVFQNGQRVQI